MFFKDNGAYSVKLSDFGIINSAAVPDWTAPEVNTSGHVRTYFTLITVIFYSTHLQIYVQTKSSDVFSLGCLFYFVVYGSILWLEFGKTYNHVEAKLREKLQIMIDQDKITNQNTNLSQAAVNQSNIVVQNQNPNANQEFLLMDLLIRILKFDKDNRLSTQKIFYHPSFWGATKCISFINAIRKKFDVIRSDYLNKLISSLSVNQRQPITDNKFMNILKSVKTNINSLVTKYHNEFSISDMKILKKVNEIVEVKLQNEYNQQTVASFPNVNTVEEKIAYLIDNIDQAHPSAETIIQLPIVNQLMNDLDSNNEVVHKDWIKKLDPKLAALFERGYDKEKVSDLLKVIRDKVNYSQKFSHFYSSALIFF